MIVDSSAVISILRNEDDSADFAKVIQSSKIRRISAINFVEAAAVIDGEKNVMASRRFDDFFRASRISIEAVTPSQAEIARQAYRDFGKGHHKAKLNLGDCFAYALAKEKDEPLLFKGIDFAQTDVEVAKF